ncbi:hypothetical protein [Photobacterium sp. 53610]|uniref:hypothetical protein n=1 Tax=Photobacterium sp. 53610 TaxID=3102789 RepID=UPI002EDA52D0
MSWHVIRIFWLSFLALVFPAQAMACLDDKGAAITVKSTVISQSQLIDAVLCEHETQHQKPQNPSPVSETHHSGYAVAILHSYRWNIPDRNNLHDGEPDLLDTPPFYPVSVPRLPLCLVRQPSYASYQDFPTSYRLSGWKETNAMYVALNSQYFS